MKTAKEVLESMDSVELLVDKHLSNIESIVYEAAKNGRYMVDVTLNFISRTRNDKAFLREAIQEKLVSLGYAVSEISNDYFTTVIRVSWHPDPEFLGK